MTYPRAHLIHEDEPGCYHLVSRCVRRAFLCGEDTLTGIDYSHRRIWLETRILELARCFAVDVHAYAIMSNHYHIVVHTDPRRVDRLTSEEVAQRWVRALQNPDRPLDPAAFKDKVEAILTEPVERIEVLRRRLRSVSWYMARINEPMARRCNQEDDCKGRFWQGRFYSGEMLDDPAVLKCMVYADLNPVRAGVAQGIEESSHTGIRRRLDRIEQAPESIGDVMRAITSEPHTDGPLVGLTSREYLDLVRWTGENIIHPGKASLAPGTATALGAMGIDLNDWSEQVGMCRNRLRAYGSPANLSRYAARSGLRYVRGGAALHAR